MQAYLFLDVGVDLEIPEIKLGNIVDEGWLSIFFLWFPASNLASELHHK